MKKQHVLFVALVLALVLCFSFGAMAASDDSGYVNDYELVGLDNTVTDGNVTIETVGQWRTANGATATETYFDGGEALSDDDIIITNGEAAIVLAVGTRNPWGYPSGSVLDAGVVKNGAGVRDTTWSIEFLADWWDSWAPNNCGTVTFEIVNYDFANKVEADDGDLAVKVSRVYDLPGGYGTDDQNNDKKFDIVTYYGAPQEGSYLYMFDSMTNTSGEQIWYNGYEGYTGYQGTGDGYENIAFAVTNKGDDGAAMYGKGFGYQTVGSYANTIGKEGYEWQGQYMTSFVIPETSFESNLGNDFVISGNGGKSGYQELYVINSANEEVEASGNRMMFDVDEAVTFGEYIVCSDKADHAALNKFLFAQQDLKTKNVEFKGVRGVKGDMEIILYKDGKSIGWYTFEADKGGKIKLPAGQYTYKVEKAGYCTSAEGSFEVVISKPARPTPPINVQFGTEKVTVNVSVKDQDGKDLFAKVGVYNENGVALANSLYPIVRYCGNSVYQTAGARGNAVQVEVPKDTACYLKVFGEGYFFTSKPVEYKLEAEDAVAGNNIEIVVDETYAVDEGWYASDFHHHTNKNDAFALPEDVVNSFLVSGLNMVTHTDHDFTENNQRSYDYITDTVNASGNDVMAFLPSFEISCSWAHFNVVPQTADAYDWFIDKDATNAPVKDADGIGYAFTDLKYFVSEINAKGASVTANHPWYSYGLFTALGKDAVPGGYVDDYGMIGLNGSYRDNEMSKTIRSGMDLWDAYRDYYENGKGVAKVGAEVEVTETHYFAGGSDTHDVLTPYATNVAEKSTKRWEDREEFYTGKIRSIAKVDGVSTDGDYLKDNALAFGKAMVNGNSYATTGPILSLPAAPGNNADGEINLNNVLAGGSFDMDIDITALYGIRDIVVLTDEATGTYDAYTGSTNDLGINFKRQFELSHADADLSIANGIDGTESDPTLCAITDSTDRTTEYTFNLSYAPESIGLHWVALCIVDVNGNFAVTNPYWVSCNLFPDVAADAWYADAVADCMFAGIINGCDDGNFQADRPVTRGEFCAMLCRFANISDEDLDAAKTTFPDNTNWAKKYISFLADRKVITGYPNGNVGPEDPIDRAQAATILCRYCGLDPVTGNSMFPDVSAKAWYAPYTNAVGKAGIMKGNEKGLFMPDRITSRAEAAQMFSNLLK